MTHRRASHNTTDTTSATGLLAALATAAALLCTGTESARAAETASDGPNASTSPAARERALREAAGPLRWIRLASEVATRKAEEPKRSAAAAVVPSSVPAKKAAPAVHDNTRTTVASLSPTVTQGGVADALVRPSSEPMPATSVDANPRGTEVPATAAAPKLVVIDEAAPEWDEDLLRTLHKGRVIARFHVSEDGYLSSIKILESSSPRLIGPVMAALMQWRFNPIPEAQTATAEFGFDSSSGKQAAN